jgi:hypothetical protein
VRFLQAPSDREAYLNSLRRVFTLVIHRISSSRKSPQNQITSAKELRCFTDRLRHILQTCFRILYIFFPRWMCPMTPVVSGSTFFRTITGRPTKPSSPSKLNSSSSFAPTGIPISSIKAKRVCGSWFLRQLTMLGFYEPPPPCRLHPH